jgi:flagellar basal-body rod modification protein FlgD
MAGTTSGVATASQQQLSYLNLLVTQMQNQNPLEPMDSQDMAAQLAQISQLEQMERLNGTFSSVLATTQWNYAASLVGATIEFASPYTGLPVREVVTGVELVNDEIRLRAGARTVGIDEVFGIRK